MQFTQTKRETLEHPLVVNKIVLSLNNKINSCAIIINNRCWRIEGSKFTTKISVDVLDLGRIVANKSLIASNLL